MQQKKKYNIAVVYDPLYKRGGAEVHLRYILDTFQKKTLFTAYCDREFVKREFPDIEIKTSFMQYLPWKFKLKNFYNLFLPLAYRSLRFKGFDGILSLSISFAKFAKGNIPHINICMSPPKFLWMKEGRSIKGKEQLKGIDKLLFGIYSFFMNTFVEDIWRKWDRNAARKLDRIVAISNVVKDRIKKYYDLDADVIYTPVDVTGISKASKGFNKENWYLYLGRVETYKGVELAIRACLDAKVPLKVGGIGNDLERMKNLVKELNAKGLVKFLGYYSDEEKPVLLAKAKALLFPVKGEDFGIVPVEANAAGTAVIAYRDGGVVETVSDVNPKTGKFFDEYDFKSLSKILKKFDEKEYKADNCRKQAAEFASEIFQYKLKTYVQDILAGSK
ncbi:glycosyltransferase family 4 protein [Candidatus Dojkabacteria bacterium]|jgi:glycosyltransferase involved in cell wall biosynthesis|uniref:Glycosyltransferase family 4 protein n=1 Tax=Candidatus Dojkabacteria bacterium TaxID=2099670 RepID=A0A847ET64_9BACT|nr:glycosyltransferase family 4 protein [Candidatus Dojkabacteria bacterium]